MEVKKLIWSKEILTLHHLITCVIIENMERGILSMNNKIAIGIDDFRELRDGAYQYVDKSMLIHDLLSNGGKVTLFTRPRRFGKTLNMTMLREFFDCTKDSEPLFSDLLIAKSESYQYMNGYPTLYFSFKDCKGSMDGVVKNMYSILLNQYKQYDFVKSRLSSIDLQLYEEVVSILLKKEVEKREDVEHAIFFLTELLYKYYKKSVMLLIDEYDTPLEAAYAGGFYDDVHTFVSGLYSSALKGNAYIKKGILTGIQRISKENIFSGLNNLIVESVVDSEFNEYFGFTEEETEKILCLNGMDLTLEVKEMYNGYNFGGTAIYNPWSVLNYVKNKRLSSYWVNTASNKTIKDLIMRYRTHSDFSEGFESLLTTGSAYVRLDMTASYAEEPKVATLWALLLHAGYITMNQISHSIGRVEIKLPNKEVKEAFAQIIEKEMLAVKESKP